MPMMNSEARKRSQSTTDGWVTPTGAADPRWAAIELADRWDREADHEEACGNGIAAVILHAHARDLREALASRLSA